MATDSDLLRVPLTAFLRGETFPPFEAESLPRHAWGLFEAIDADGDLTWAERMTDAADVESLFAQLSGYLGDLVRHDTWLEDDETSMPDDAALADAGTPGQALAEEDQAEVELDSRFDAMRFVDLDPGLRLTGRYVFMVLLAREEGQDSSAVLFDRGLNAYEVEGLLRVAQLRFTETLSWSDPEPSIIVPADPPERGTLGGLFPGWSFPRLADGVELSSCWTALLVESPEGESDWMERHSEPLEHDRLAGVLAWRLRHLEEYSVASWDDPDDRPGFPTTMRFMGSAAGNVDADSEPFSGEFPEGFPEDLSEETVEELLAIAAAGPGAYDPTRRDGALDARVASMECFALADGESAVRAFMVGLGTDADGDPYTYLAYAARPSWNPSLDFFSDFEELGLLRSCLRDLLR